MSTDEHFQPILSNLVASILFDANSACITRIPMLNTQKKRDLRYLTFYQILCLSSSLLSLSDEDFKSWASESAETWTAGKNKYHVFAYHMHNLYSDIVGSAFQELPHKIKVTHCTCSGCSVVSSFSWKLLPFRSSFYCSDFFALQLTSSMPCITI